MARSSKRASCAAPRCKSARERQQSYVFNEARPLEVNRRTGMQFGIDVDTHRLPFARERIMPLIDCFRFFHASRLSRVVRNRSLCGSGLQWSKIKDLLFNENQRLARSESPRSTIFMSRTYDVMQRRAPIAPLHATLHKALGDPSRHALHVGARKSWLRELLPLRNTLKSVRRTTANAEQAFKPSIH
ncbi:hypothetical protein ACVI1T_004785 [Rhizobium redzepovicii]